MRIIILLLLLLPGLANSQSDTADCWACILHAQDHNAELAIDECAAYVKHYKDDRSATIAQFLLARSYMDLDDFEAAANILESITGSSGVLTAMIEGLKGDCLSEQNKWQEAQIQYEIAVKADYNEYTVPNYLFKAYLCAKENGNIEQGQSYLKTIYRYFPYTPLGLSMAKYLTNEEVVPYEIVIPEIKRPETGLGIGTVYDERLDEKAFYRMYAEQQSMADINRSAQGLPPEPLDLDQVFESFIQKLILNRECDQLGIQLTEEEFNAYFYGVNGFTPLQELVLNFRDTEGNFDRELLRRRVEEMATSDDPFMRELWENYKEELIQRRKEEKLRTIYSRSAYTTTLEARNAFIEENTKKEISYVLQRYSSIDDEDIDVSEENLRSYYEQNKKGADYLIREGVKELQYVELMIQPSAKDSAAFQKELASIKKQFNKAENDSLFVKEFSTGGVYLSGPYSTAVPEDFGQHSFLTYSYPSEWEPEFAKAKIGDVLGPFEIEGKHLIAKVNGFTKETINARHILIPVEEGREAEADELADSLLKRINNENFAQYVESYSVDHGSKMRGGELGDFFFSQMVAPFAIYCVEEPIGKIGKVRTQFGLHIVQVLDRKGRDFPRLTVVERELKPSKETLTAIERETNELFAKLKAALEKESDPYQKVKQFESITNDNGSFPRMMVFRDNKPTMYNIYEDSNKVQLLRLAFTSKNVGKLIDTPIRDGDRYLIAIVSGMKEPGIAPFEEALSIVKASYVRDRKAEIIEGRMNEAMSLEGLENRENRINIYHTQISMDDPAIEGAGMDPGVIGKIFEGVEDGELSVAIQGNQGVYRAVVEKTEREAVPDDLARLKNDLTNESESIMKYQLMKILKHRARVIDNRLLYLNDIRN